MSEPWADDPDAGQIRAALAGKDAGTQRRFRLFYRLLRFLEAAGISRHDVIAVMWLIWGRKYLRHLERSENDGQ